MNEYDKDKQKLAEKNKMNERSYYKPGFELDTYEWIQKGVKATGGGVYRPILSTIGAQMLAVMGDQIKPLLNNCDMASSYYLNDNNVLLNENCQTLDVLPPPTNKTSPIPQTYVPQTLFLPAVPKTSKIKKKQTKNYELFKKKYYSTEMKCALWEKKTKILEYKMALKRQKLLELEIKIKEKEYQNICNKQKILKFTKHLVVV